MACPSLVEVILREGLSEIGHHAFEESALNGLHIPSTVSSIGEPGPLPFPTEVSVAAGNPGYMSVDGVLFTADGGELILYPAARDGRSHTVPEGTGVVAPFAFTASRSLESVILPDSLVRISDGAFERCTSLESVVIPDSVETIGESAFWQCLSLESVVSGGSVTGIGNEMNPVEVTVRSESEYGFLDGSGGEYTTFVYIPLRFL